MRICDRCESKHDIQQVWFELGVVVMALKVPGMHELCNSCINDVNKFIKKKSINKEDNNA